MGGREQVFVTTSRMRRDLADLIAGLDERALATPSMCAGWDVLTCVAHTACLDGSLAGFMLAMVRYGGPHRANTGMARRLADQGRDAVVASLRGNADRRISPPGVREYGQFVDQMIHGFDIRRPIGVRRDPEPDDVRAALGFLTTGRTVGFVRRGVLTGLRVDAVNVAFQSGDGPMVRGRASIWRRPCAAEPRSSKTSPTMESPSSAGALYKRCISTALALTVPGTHRR
jgi:uncharacterized protein (TIGR03083 family)